MCTKCWTIWSVASVEARPVILTCNRVCFILRIYLPSLKKVITNVHIISTTHSCPYSWWLSLDLAIYCEIESWKYYCNDGMKSCILIFPYLFVDNWQRLWPKCLYLYMLFCLLFAKLTSHILVYFKFSWTQCALTFKIHLMKRIHNCGCPCLATVRDMVVL